MTQKKIKFSFGKSVVFSLIIFTVIFSTLEFASYYYLTRFSETGTFNERVLQNVFHPFLGWRHPANARLKTSKPFFYFAKDAFIKTDQDGHSITPLSYDKPELTIVITGGSSTFGVGATSNSSTVASQLERKIVERLGVKAEVVNLGVRGYNSFQELLSLHEYLVDHQADIVIALSGNNDAELGGQNNALKYALLQKDIFDRVVPLVQDAEKQRPILLNPAGFLRKYSYFFDLSFRLLYRLIGQPSMYGNLIEDIATVEYDPKNIPDRVKISVRNYAMMRTLAESAGAAFVLALQPDAYTWSGYPGKIRHILDNKDEFDRKSVYVAAYLDKLAREAASLNLADMRNAMDTINTSPYVDSIHYTDSGAGRLADALVEVIEPIIPRVNSSQ